MEVNDRLSDTLTTEDAAQERPGTSYTANRVQLQTALSLVAMHSRRPTYAFLLKSCLALPVFDMCEEQREVDLAIFVSVGRP